MATTNVTTAQTEAALSGYQCISVNPVSAEVFRDELISWISIVNDQLDALQQEYQIGTSTLLAIPNLAFEADEVLSIIKGFGETAPYGTYVHLPLFAEYTGRELSGTNPANQREVKFSLVFDGPVETAKGSVAEQRSNLDELQRNYPNLKVPSVLDAVSHWYTLRNGGFKMSGYGMFEKTVIRHFDLPEKMMDLDNCVLRSYVDFFGESFLLRSNFESKFGARLSLQ